MEENIIARGTRVGKASKHKTIILITVIVVAVLMLIGIITNIVRASDMVKHHVHTRYCYSYSYRSDFYEDQANGKLWEYKMDCYYADGAFGIGLRNYFNGGFILPLLIAVGGISVALANRSRARGYELLVTEQAATVTYSNGKTVEIPLCSVFTVGKEKEKDLNVVTSENNFTFRDMEGRDDVYDAIAARIPDLTVKSPVNSEQVLAKGYPPAIKPFLLVLLILFSLAAVIGAIAAEAVGVLLVGLVPIAIVLVFYLLAKTPYFVVTDKRVFYVSDFGRKLSLPVTKITVVVTHRWFGQLHIAAPTGRIHLFWVKNTGELYDAITALLNEKQ